MISLLAALSFNTTYSLTQSQLNRKLIEKIADGNLEQVKKFVSQGAQINAQNREGISPLMMASRWGHSGVVQWLIENGADINLTDEHGQQAVHYAVENYLVQEDKRIQVLQSLIDNGVHINAADNNGIRPLDIAVQNPSAIPTIERLIYHGAHLDVQTTSHAAHSKAIKTLIYLLEHGAHSTQAGQVSNKLIIEAIQGNETIPQLIKTLLLALMAGDSDAIIKLIEERTEIPQSTLALLNRTMIGQTGKNIIATILISAVGQGLISVAEHILQLPDTTFDQDALEQTLISSIASNNFATLNFVLNRFKDILSEERFKTALIRGLQIAASQGLENVILPLIQLVIQHIIIFDTVWLKQLLILSALSNNITTFSSLYSYVRSHLSEEDFTSALEDVLYQLVQQNRSSTSIVEFIIDHAYGRQHAPSLTMERTIERVNTLLKPETLTAGHRKELTLLREILIKAIKAQLEARIAIRPASPLVSNLPPEVIAIITYFLFQPHHKSI